MSCMRAALVFGLAGVRGCASVASPEVQVAAPASIAIETPLSLSPPQPRAEAHVATSEEPRLGWPADGRIAGLYAHIGMIGAPAFAGFLDRIARNGMNAVVVDGKDYSGWLTYPSTIPFATEMHAQSHAVLRSLRDLVHAAHARGVRVLLRIACFHDAWTTQRRPDLALQGVADWVDPRSSVVQDYLLAVVDETLLTGVDEIQLDYVRFPTEKSGGAPFRHDGTVTTDVIAGFVKRVHERTQAAGVPLSIDVFGVVAWRHPVEVRATGQDLSKLGAFVEAVSPMVYPSHFDKGFNGYAQPGDHPVVVGLGTKEAVEVLRKTGSSAVVRCWIQAFPWRAPSYGSPYVAGEIDQAKAAGGSGWLAWNAGGFYGEVFAAASQQRPPVSLEVAP
jgi:hypothetical protein